MAKILIVCNYDFTFNKYMIPLSNALTKQGHQVDVACDGAAIDSNKVDGNIEFHSLDVPRKITIFGFISSILRLRNIISTEQYDIVNSNNRNTSFIARLALITMPFTSAKSVYTARGMYFHDSQRLLPKFITYCLEVFLLFFTDRVMSQSKEDIDKLKKIPLVNEKKLCVIHNGIDINSFSISNTNKPSIELKGFVICTTCRVVKEKGLMDLLKAYAKFYQKHPNSSLLIIGGALHEEHNYLLDQFIQETEKLNIKDNVKITGLIENVEDYLSVADIYVHPSYREGVPRSLLEAMSLEKVVLATRIRGANEILTNGKNGYLYEKGNIDELLQQLQLIYNLLPKKKELIQSNARKRVVKQYNEKDYVERQVSILEGLL